MNKNLITNLLILIISIVILVFTIINLPPDSEQSNIIIVTALFSFFMAVSSFFTFIFFFSAEIFYRKKLGVKTFGRSSRRGFLVGLFGICSLLLFLFDINGPLEIILLLLLFCLVEWVIDSDRIYKPK